MPLRDLVANDPTHIRLGRPVKGVCSGRPCPAKGMRFKRRGRGASPVAAAVNGWARACCPGGGSGISRSGGLRRQKGEACPGVNQDQGLGGGPSRAGETQAGVQPRLWRPSPPNQPLSMRGETGKPLARRAVLKGSEGWGHFPRGGNLPPRIGLLKRLPLTRARDGSSLVGRAGDPPLGNGRLTSTH